MQANVVIDNQLVKKHFSLVKRIAQHMLVKLSNCVQLDDLIQSGMIGLLEAAKNYNTEKGASFETYASIRIRGSMLDEVRKGDWAPRSVHRNTRRLAEVIQQLRQESGRDPQGKEVAHTLNMSLDEYHRLVQETMSSKMFYFSTEGVNEENIVGMSSPFDKLQKEDFKQCLSRGIESLNEREQRVLNLYYNEEFNLREVGEKLGVSESRISQIHAQAVAKLQTRLKEWFSDET